MLKTKLTQTAIKSIVEDAISLADPGQPVDEPRKLDWRSAEGMAERQFVMLVSSLFALTALMLAIVGVHGIVASRMADRRLELAIRVALGASSMALRWFAARSELVPLLAGVTLGGGATYALAGFMGPLLHGVSPTSLPVYFSIAAVVLATGAIVLTASTRKLDRDDLWTVLNANPSK